MNYEQIERTLMLYIEDCRARIKNLTFSDKQINSSVRIKNALIRKGKIEEDTSVEDAIKFHRQEYLDVKLRHSLRVVDNAVDIAKRMHAHDDFIELLKMMALLHDLGRFDQATWSDNFMDEVYNAKNKDNPYCGKRISTMSNKQAIITNHDRAGYYLLFEENKIKDYEIDPKYYSVIKDTVYYHGDAYLPEYLNTDLTEHFKKGISLALQLNIISAAIIQIIRDADKIDILYQYTTSDLAVTREDFSYPIMSDSIDIVASKFGLSIDEILEWNGIILDEFNNKKRVSIPLKNVQPNILKIDSKFRQRLISNEFITIKELSKRRDQHFITVIWWRLSTFLNDINFVATLINVKESNLLDKIYQKYPDKYKPLVDEIFNYSRNILIDKAIINNKASIYLQNKTSILT